MMPPETLIAEVETSFLSIPLDRPLVTAAFPIPAIDTALVRVRTRGGHEGVAWSFAFGRGKVASLVRFIQDLGEFAVGKDATHTAALWSQMFRSAGFIGHVGHRHGLLGHPGQGGRAAGLPTPRWVPRLDRGVREPGSVVGQVP
jgi:hypothetical protein